MNTRRVVSFSLVLGLVGALGFTHDLWIFGMPGLYLAQPGGLFLRTTVGPQFPQPETPVPQERVEDSYLTGPGIERMNLPWRKRTQWSQIYLSMGSPGHFYAVLVQKPRWIELKPEDFNNYLQHEGLEKAWQIRQERGETNQPAREIYTRFIKALIHIHSDTVPEAHEVYTWAYRPVGLKVEIVPRTHACHGGNVTIQVLAEGKPLPDQTVIYMTRGIDPRRVKTDARGEATLQIDRPGLWLVKTIRMMRPEEPATLDNKTAEWVSEWAILTFEARP